MTACLADTIDPAFEILAPDEAATPLVFNSPHSGRIYPRAFVEQAKLDFPTLRRSEDSFVDELFLPAVEAGAPLMRALFPRAFLDLNREPYELDPRMFEGRLPPFANTRSIRVSGGLGTIARVVGDAQEIYPRRLAVAEGLERIEAYYKPYHQALRRLVARTQRRFGVCVLVDCHSMPSVSTRDDAARADFVIGDRYGTSCAEAVTDALERELLALGYRVVRNKPYAGGYITEHYGNPSAGLHAVQIEINRGLYMEEAIYERSAGFGALRTDIGTLVPRLMAAVSEALEPPRAAAE
ncbi:N-formylglutamate amidohydrolase [Xanthobacter tagetidis]|uniref:N-formylglutamate amidohydrolase n=1 Tax=Xanthobacter tagetidis TaxID=60216 RepID=A0A3L7AK95_9HYPH|nr:N-formylglutamate amidohydrolase [Xanthobacter tagetidis]MBB6306928.1 N-formylglutamate deformylase [Xanthobacter tagetidis]RLP80008.1 N-formylglutamate amidohydrolase [Xanthobacter tagetidis]